MFFMFHTQRADIINKLANLLVERSDEILAANKQDMDVARMSKYYYKLQ